MRMAQFENQNKREISNPIKITLSSVFLLVGGSIYLLFRTERLLMFKFVRFIHLDAPLSYMRNALSYIQLPKWIKYSLPNFLWMMSYLLIIDVVWKGKFNLKSSIWYIGMPAIAVASEILQAFHLVSGTFDYLDLFSYLMPVILFILFKGLSYEKSD